MEIRKDPTGEFLITLPDLPASWTLDELSELRRKLEVNGQGISMVTDTLTALCGALAAKRVFLAVGGSRLELGQLQVTYRHEIGAWPDGNSADALLVEAASAGIVERRRPSAVGPLGALALRRRGGSSTRKSSEGKRSDGTLDRLPGASGG
jgi:hypothetical protein